MRQANAVIRLCLTTALLVGMAGAASAQDSSVILRQNRGFYMGLGGGVNLMSDNDFRNRIFGTESKVKYDPGWVVSVPIGYAFGNGLRVELEPSYRRNSVDKIDGVGGSGRMEVPAILANVIYDFDLHTPFIPLVPHLGAGIGYARPMTRTAPVDGLLIQHHDDTLAFQGIAGLEYALSPGVKLGLDYRYLVAHDADFRIAGTDSKSHVGDIDNHSILATLRYEFGTPPVQPAPQPVAAPAPPPPPAPVPAPTARPATPPPAPQLYTVYFDFNSARLPTSAVPVIQQAAATAKQGNVTRITVTGHADTVGSATYNQRLSERRAQAVRQELIRDGVPANEIVVVGRGKTDLAVPTADGVREPRNRRVVIELQGPGA